MLEYIQLYPETIAAVRRYPAADRALLYEAMAAYGIEGTDPDWPEDDLKWLIWESLRQRVDLAARKSETNRNNRKRTTTNNNEMERTTTNDNETERNETNNNPQSESESESESDAEAEQDPDAVTPENDTHTGEQQEGNAGARACEGGQGMIVDELHALPCPMPRTFTPPEVRVIPPGWYNPAAPDAPCDSAWQGSETARRAVAQRIADYVLSQGIVDRQTVNTDGGRVFGAELVPALCAAMAQGLPPWDCQREAVGAGTAWGWEYRLKRYVDRYGTAPPEWREDLRDLKEDYTGLVAYG